MARRRAHDKHPLLEVERLDIPVGHYLEASGDVFATFLQQDSGCRSYGVIIDDERWFVKASARDDAAESLHRAVKLHRAGSHRHVIPLRHVMTTPAGPALVYPGSTARCSTARRWTRAVDEILPAHTLASGPFPSPRWSRRWMPSSMRIRPSSPPASWPSISTTAASIYDVARRHVWLCDLDEYRPGPFVLDADRLSGSTRFMAPEEWQRGARIYERTTVFNLGRSALVLLDEGDDEGCFRGPADAAAVLARATRRDPRDRHQALRAFVDEWRATLA